MYTQGTHTHLHTDRDDGISSDWWRISASNNIQGQPDKQPASIAWNWTKIKHSQLLQVHQKQYAVLHSDILNKKVTEHI